MTDHEQDAGFPGEFRHESSAPKRAGGETGVLPSPMKGEGRISQNLLESPLASPVVLSDDN